VIEICDWKIRVYDIDESGVAAGEGESTGHRQRATLWPKQGSPQELDDRPEEYAARRSPATSGSASSRRRASRARRVLPVGAAGTGGMELMTWCRLLTRS
jgi:hypothetical protein